MTPCVICGNRRVHGVGRCHICDSQIAADTRRKRPAQPVKFITYRGHVVGLFPNGDKTLLGRLLKRDPDKLPKSRTIDLNKWCEGYTREIIKGFKAKVLRLAQA